MSLRIIMDMYHKGSSSPGHVKDIPQDKIVRACKHFENIYQQYQIHQDALQHLEHVNELYEELNHELIKLSTFEQLNKFKNRIRR